MSELTMSPPPTSEMSFMLPFYKLLSQASSLPCSSGATTFLSLVTSEDEQFSLALDILLPALQNQDVQPPLRILAAYVLHALYASHDRLNPFHDQLHHIFDSERTAAVARSRIFQLAGSPEVHRSRKEGATDLQAENEQLVWVLWKIVKGEGEDLAPYSPNILSRTALPEHLRASHLVLQNAKNSDPHRSVNDHYHSIPTNPPFTHQRATASFQKHSPHFEQETSLPTSFSPADSLTPYFTPPSSQTYHTSAFSPFGPENILDGANERGSEGSDSNRWRPEASPSDFYQDQVQFDLSRRLEAQSLRSQSDILPSHEPAVPSPSTANQDHRREALLHALCAEPPREIKFQTRGRSEVPLYLRTGNPGIDGRSGDIYDPGREAGRSGPNLGSGYVLNHGLRVPLMQRSPTQHSPTSSSVPSPVEPQFFTAQNNELLSLGRQADAPGSSTGTHSTSYSDTTLRPQLGPIARPRPAPSLFYNSTSQEATSVTINESSSQNARPAYSQVAQTTLIDRTQGPVHVSSGSGLLSQLRSPGVIGSGRPSKSISPVGSDAGERGRHPDAGVIGNGRLPRHSPIAKTDLAGEDTVRMIPRSVERAELRRPEAGKRDFGAIGQPRTNAREAGEWPVEGNPSGVELLRPHEDQVSDVLPAHHSAASAAWTSTSKRSREDFKIISLSSEEAQRRTPSEFSVLGVDSISSPNLSTETASSPDTSNSASSSSSQNHLPIPTSTSLSGISDSNQSRQESENLRTSRILAASVGVNPRSEIDERERDELSRAILLLLSARERVLTLSEQRTLIPQLEMLARPLSLLRPSDIQSLVAKNPDVAGKLLILLLDRDEEDGAKVERLLGDVSKNDLFTLDSAQRPFDAALFASINAVNAVQTVVQFVTGVVDSSSAGQNKFSAFGGREAREGYLEALRQLPPTMQSFNLIARLLRPASLSPVVVSELSDNQDSPEVRVARLVKTDVIGGLVNGCIRWIEKAEEAEKDGEVLDDRVAVSVSNLSRFYASLLKHDFVSAESEVDTTEIMSFALHFSRFEDARSLYSTLAAARA